MLVDLYNYTLSLIKIVKINDIIDILAVSVVIYGIFRMIRETRAEQLIRGIILFLIMTQISEWLQMRALHFLFQSTFQVGIIAILVIFQPELRKALENIGKSHIDIHTFKTEKSYLPFADEIVAAAVSCSGMKIGCLIVIERNTKIGDIIDTGVKINSDVTAPLLINIFTPNTPLHDGAVIIRKSKIMAAACVLPLTQNKSITQELGTRHRAAIGISEYSDSFVVIVSEETGRISIASEGNLIRNLSAQSLKNAILKLIVKK